MTNLWRNLLLACNSFFILLGILLVVLGGVAYGSTLISVGVAGGVIASGVLLWLISVVGIVGAVRQSPVILFVYMGLMAVLILVQLSTSIACLALTADQLPAIIESAWVNILKLEDKKTIEDLYKCCGLKSEWRDLPVTDTQGPGHDCLLDPFVDQGVCEADIVESLSIDLKAAGGTGLFFSFVEVIGIVLAVKARSVKPKLKQSVYL